MMCTVFAGCSENNGDSAKDNTEPEATQSSEATAAAETEAPATAAQAETTAGNDSSALIGSWEYESGGFTYTFNADGTGTYDVYGEVMNFTYTDNGSSIEMLFDDVDTPSTYEYSIEGDALTIKDSFGEDVKYIKK